jgi:predicted ATPase
MISGIEIRGFKRFQRQPFALAPLTILAGLNGSGKTSLIHALLLAWEASVTGSKTVRLNGPFGLELGSAEDVRNWEAGDTIELYVASGTSRHAIWKFGLPSDQALYLTVEERPDKPPAAFSGHTRAFSYLSAERLGPRSILGAAPLPASELEVGVRGEYCAHIIAAIGDKLIEDKSRLHPNREPNAPALLKYEVERWLSEIARPIEIDAEQYPGSSVTALRFRAPSDGEWVRAPNMGFGVSYALPIILAGLIAEKSGLLIVENPEAHLHPAGQSRMGVFLAWIASQGIQVIIETHSDHVLNGIRRAIGEFKYLNSDAATVSFIDSAQHDAPRVHQLNFTPIGGISHWPRGFFDQYQIDAASLGRIRRRA